MSRYPRWCVLSIHQGHAGLNAWLYKGSQFKCEKMRGSFLGTSDQLHAQQLALEMSERFSSLAPLVMRLCTNRD